MAEFPGFTGLGALSLPGFPILPLPGHLVTVVAGPYPPHCPPDAWSPGLPAPPGPCYWLVASGIPMGWRGGCLAAGLVRSTVCYYCLGGCSALVLCARRSRQVWGVGAGAGSRFSFWAPPCPRVPPGACCGLSCPGIASLRVPVRHSMRSVRSTGSVWLPFESAPRVCCVCLRSCFRGVRAPPPPGSVWRPPYARFWCRAPVGPFQAVRAPPRFLPQSRAPPI